MLARSVRSPALRQRGLSLIEMMVGITVGMIVVAGASLMMTNQVNEHRRLMLETQTQQDLRATADLMLRDLRRAGFWATPQFGVWTPGSASAAASNSYATVALSADPQDGNQVSYSYSRASNITQVVSPTVSTPEDNVVANNESFGFRLSNDVLQSKLGLQWQPLTDPNTLVVTAFSVTLNVQPLSLDGYCSKPCPAGLANCPPQQQIRRFDISITGHSKHDSNVVRAVSVSSRVRNDQITGSCPP